EVSGGGPSPVLPAEGLPDYPLQITRDGSRIAIAGFWLRGEVDLARGDARARFAEKDAAGSVENFLRVAPAHLLLPRRGFLLHACAAVDGDGAVVAFGPSGAGKTTLASLAGDRPVISDDLVALAFVDDELRAIPAPFREGGAAPAPRGHRV